MIGWKKQDQPTCFTDETCDDTKILLFTLYLDILSTTPTASGKCHMFLVNGHGTQLFEI
jgi:hypothetical protein